MLSFSVLVALPSRSSHSIALEQLPVEITVHKRTAYNVGAQFSRTRTPPTDVNGHLGDSRLCWTLRLRADPGAGNLLLPFEAASVPHSWCAAMLQLAIDSTHVRCVSHVVVLARRALPEHDPVLEPDLHCGESLQLLWLHHQLSNGFDRIARWLRST